MDMSKLRERTREELKADLMDLRKEQFNLRIQQTSGQLTQTHQLRNVRRNIARMKLVLDEK